MVVRKGRRYRLDPLLLGYEMLANVNAVDAGCPLQGVVGKPMSQICFIPYVLQIETANQNLEGLTVVFCPVVSDCDITQLKSSANRRPNRRIGNSDRRSVL